MRCGKSPSHFLINAVHSLMERMWTSEGGTKILIFLRGFFPNAHFWYTSWKTEKNVPVDWTSLMVPLWDRQDSPALFFGRLPRFWGSRTPSLKCGPSFDVCLGLLSENPVAVCLRLFSEPESRKILNRCGGGHCLFLFEISLKIVNSLTNRFTNDF